jgi:hypothetical protein
MTKQSTITKIYDAFLIYDNFYFNEINSTHIYRLKQKVDNNKQNYDKTWL